MHFCFIFDVLHKIHCSRAMLTIKKLYIVFKATRMIYVFNFLNNFEYNNHYTLMFYVIHIFTSLYW